MKKVFFSLLCSAILCANFSAKAQSIDEIKTLVILQKFKDAIPLIAKAATNPKIMNKPELYAFKLLAYNGLAKDATATPEQKLANRDEAQAAWEKYQSLDPKYTLMQDVTYSGGPGTLYSSYYTEAISKFNAKDWSSSYNDFKHCLSITDVLIANKLASMSFDTTCTMYGAICAQNLKKDDDAIILFQKMAEKKIAGETDYIIPYQSLAKYYMEKKDEANFYKYVNLGKSLYPNDKFLQNIDGEYVRSLNDFDKLMAYYDKKAAADPTNYDLQYDIGADLYNYILPKDTSKTLNGDVSKYEDKMIEAFTKASNIKPETGIPFTNIGLYFINRAIITNNNGIKKVGNDIKNFNKGAKPDKTGKLPPIPKALLLKKEEYNKQYDSAEDKAIVYFEKAVDKFGKATKLDGIEKKNYKDAVSYLIDLNSEKKGVFAKKPAEAAKYAAAEKKWTALYSSIK